jgi:hypothetical protein
VQPLTVTENGTWDAPDGQAYDPVTVDVKAVTEPITITENGVYPVPKGGGLVEGETYTLKNNLNDIDPNDFMNFPLDSEFIEAYTIFRYSPNEALGLGYLTQEAASAILGREIVSGAWMITSPDVDFEKMYIYPIKLNGADGTLIDNNAGWVSVSAAEPVPAVSVTIPSPYDASAGYSLEELAPFFDIETKSLDGWGEITVNVAGGGGAELNIAYGDTAPEDTSKLWVKTSKPSAVKVASKLKKEASDNSTLEKLTTSFSEPRQYAIGSNVGNRIYLFGGYTTSYEASIEKYDIDADVTTRLSAALPEKGSKFSAATVGENIFIFGGESGIDSDVFDTIVKFNASTETISTLGIKLPTPLVDICAVSYGTKIYLFGGSQNMAGSMPVNTIHCLDTETFVLTTLSAVLPTAYSAISGINVGNSIYLFGGYPRTKSIFKFDCETETIVTLSATLPKAISSQCLAHWDNGIYLFGGSNYGGTNGILYFDIESESVITTNTILEVANYSQTAVVTDDSIYLAGGGSKTDGIYRFTPSMSIIVAVDNLQIHSTFEKNKFNLINTDTAQVEIGVNAVYKGNADGIGELVEASLHNGTSWVTI